MSTEIQAQLEDIKKRLADLEKAEIQLRIQSVGPRGPIGPAGVIGQQGERGYTGNTGECGRDGKDGRDGVTPSKETFESTVVSLLHEYHVLDADSLPYSGPYAKK